MIRLVSQYRWVDLLYIPNSNYCSDSENDQNNITLNVV